MSQNLISWIARIVVAIIFFQTLFFKFTAAPESVALFEALGMEPYGRIGSGVAELIAGILILIPKTKAIGGLLALGIISGAILSHFAILGIEVNGDGGTLFILAVVVFIGALVTLFLHKDELPIIGKNS